MPCRLDHVQNNRCNTQTAMGNEKETQKKNQPHTHTERNKQNYDHGNQSTGKPSTDLKFKWQVRKKCKYSETKKKIASRFWL